ncbi:unnamed protein product [Schistosoma mattheei]|uniref:Uncharacterized protein n=1 Tax=Schistosoma mattheei TaxID=31246 RepID=A0A3P8GD32_9TREM|nr:unnamed protein product [Schistosoma mattheei]
MYEYHVDVYLFLDLSSILTLYCMLVYGTAYSVVESVEQLNYIDRLGPLSLYLFDKLLNLCMVC